MAKRIVGIVLALLVWAAAATLAGVVMRTAWPAYASVADALTFTLPMMIARLSIGAAATVLMGAVAVAVSRWSAAAWASGAIVLLAFLPQHISIWEKFPVWYHLTFLFSLIPLAFLGGRLVAHRRYAM
jgi:hypothetical protein